MCYIQVLLSDVSPPALQMPENWLWKNIFITGTAGMQIFSSLLL